MIPYIRKESMRNNRNPQQISLNKIFFYSKKSWKLSLWHEQFQTQSFCKVYCSLRKLGKILKMDGFFCFFFSFHFCSSFCSLYIFVCSYLKLIFPLKALPHKLPLIPWVTLLGPSTTCLQIYQHPLTTLSIFSSWLFFQSVIIFFVILDKASILKGWVLTDPNSGV